MKNTAQVEHVPIFKLAPQALRLIERFEVDCGLALLLNIKIRTSQQTIFLYKNLRRYQSSQLLEVSYLNGHQFS